MNTSSTITTLDEPQVPASNSAVKGAAKTANKGRTPMVQDDEPADAATIAGANHDDELGGETVLLTIHASSDEGGRNAVDLMHNGYLYQVPRGKAWRVPKEVAQVLADAVVASYQHDGQGGIVEINTPRYAYSIGL